MREHKEKTAGIRRDLSHQIKRRQQRARLQALQGITLTALLLALVAAGGAVARRGQDSAADRALTRANLPLTITRTVEPGDTLWSLAKRYGDPEQSMVQRVDQLRAANGFTSGIALHPGQRLLVPIGNPLERAKLRLAEEQSRPHHSRRTH